MKNQINVHFTGLKGGYLFIIRRIGAFLFNDPLPRVGAYSKEIN